VTIYRPTVPTCRDAAVRPALRKTTTRAVHCAGSSVGCAVVAGRSRQKPYARAVRNRQRASRCLTGLS
jgi:hypothetical protein